MTRTVTKWRKEEILESDGHLSTQRRRANEAAVSARLSKLNKKKEGRFELLQEMQPADICATEGNGVATMRGSTHIARNCSHGLTFGVKGTGKKASRGGEVAEKMGEEGS